MQIFKTEWSRDALDDLDLLWEWIYENAKDIETADSFVNRLIDHTEENCKRPQKWFFVVCDKG